jgi:exodeoxyribonuclease VII small subunit
MMHEPAELDFDAALERLEQIAVALEMDDLELAQSLALFEEGVALLRLAESRLGGAEQRVRTLIEEGGSTRFEMLPELG